MIKLGIYKCEFNPYMYVKVEPDKPIIYLLLYMDDINEIFLWVQNEGFKGYKEDIEYGNKER